MNNEFEIIFRSTRFVIVDKDKEILISRNSFRLNFIEIRKTLNRYNFENCEF